MIPKQKWVERTFNFDYPVSRFPCIFERVRGTAARLEELMRPFPTDILAVEIDGRWSIKEQIGHLCDLDELHDARIDDFLAGANTLRPADMKNKKTYDANHNATPVEVLLKRFRDARAHFVQRIEGMKEQQLSLVALHPRLQQQMRLIDMVFFVAEHDDHHIASISEIARTLTQR
jgi:uncharacterized damage-inducible protein DinB